MSLYCCLNIELSTLQLESLLSRLVSQSCCKLGIIDIISRRSNRWGTCILE